MTADQVLAAFEGIRRAQRAGVYAPHKPLLVLWALGRVQQGQARLAPFGEVDQPLQDLLAEFGPTGAAKNRHYPFWHLSSDGDGALWVLDAPADFLARPAGATPNLGELRSLGVQGGFHPDIDATLRTVPGLLESVAARVLDEYFPDTLHADIAAAVGLDLSRPVVLAACEPPAAYMASARRRRDPGFRERVLRAYEYRCCVCGFDLRVGRISAGLEAAHIQWHHTGGPDIESNGLSLCALHHKLFDLGAFTVEPAEHRVVFSQQAIAGDRSQQGELRHHGQRLIAPQQPDMSPSPAYLAWNLKYVFKDPARRVER